MAKFSAWVKAHPYGAGAIVIVGGLLLYKLLKSGSASSGGGSIGQVAQVEAAQQAAALQAQTQGYAASVQAQAQTNAQQAQLDAIQAQVQGQQNINTTNVAGAIVGQELQTQLYKDALDAHTQQQQQFDQLAQDAIGKTGAHTNIALNELALAAGYNDVPSWNQVVGSTNVAQANTQAATNIANAQETASIVNSITGFGSDVAGALLL